MKKKTSTIKRVFKYLRKYKLPLFLSFLLAIVGVAGQLYIPILQGDAIDQIIGKGDVGFDEIVRIIVIILITMAAVALCQWVMNMCNNKITYSVVRDIRRDAFNKIQKLPVKYIDSHSSGEVVSKVISDVDQFADGLLMGFTQFFTGVMTIAATLGFMLMISWKITMVVIIITPLSFFVAAFVSKKTYSMFKLQSEARGEQTGFIDEIIGNQKLVRAYLRENKAQEQFDEINERLQKYSIRAVFFSAITNPSTRFINNIVYALVALTGAFAVVGGRFTVGRLSVFLSYSQQYTKPFNEITGVVAELQNALACANRVLDLIEEPSVVETGTKTLVVNKGDGNVTLENVAFSYTSDKELIKNFNLKVKPGQRVAIVGPTGCGKTTVINLLMRFYDVDEGSICVENMDIRDVTRPSLRASYGMVLQDTWLQSGTIRDNITTGKPDATDEEVIEAAKSAHAHSFIKRLPNGYDTVIGEDGGSLSQGQKQLLCIARVMLCLPPMLILDEATSSIDTRTEMKIQEAFAKMMKGRTSFIVAHRLSTIQSADIILVMRDGNVIEQGNHEELLAKNGFYKELYESQFS